ncbi:type IV toxin-antitoxin system AbiEi family antitoxin domain-containing protein [Stomatohabitans albus]|uniref:type IV toxin-antitoxin system AbiEi family antitoxin domain-containing protein n=1 Tax=Stomatohabitans albus TaxID=3110766 RepID=UPI00300D2F72
MDTNALAILTTLASRRQGVVTFDELIAAGFDASILRAGKRRGWQRMHRGVWYLHADPPTFTHWVLATPLICGRDGAIGGAANLFVRGVLPSPPAQIDLWIPPTRTIRPLAHTPYVVHRDKRGRLNRKDHNGMLLSLGDALLDYLNTVTDETKAATAIIGTRAKFPHQVEHCQADFIERDRQRHRHLFTTLMACEPAFDSVLEYLWLVNVEQAHNMAPSQRQWICPDGYRRDGAWPHYQTIYELDGDAFHLNPRVLKRDRDKDYAARRRGFVTLRFGWADIVERPCQTARDVATAIPQLPIEPCSPTCWV